MKRFLFLIIAGLLGLLAYQEHAHKAQIEAVRADAIQQTSDDYYRLAKIKLMNF